MKLVGGNNHRAANVISMWWLSFSSKSHKSKPSQLKPIIINLTNTNQDQMMMNIRDQRLKDLLFLNRLHSESEEDDVKHTLDNDDDNDFQLN